MKPSYISSIFPNQHFRSETAREIKTPINLKKYNKLKNGFKNMENQYSSFNILVRGFKILYY